MARLEDLDLRVEVAWAVDADTEPAPGDWVRIDADNCVRSFTTRRGRQRKLDQVEAGELKMVLDNRNAFLLIANAGSPYAPHLTKRNRQIRVIGNDGADKPVFRGYIKALRPSWHLADAVVTLEAVDGFDRLARQKLPRSVLQWGQTVQQSAVATWPMGETAGFQAEDTTGEADGTYVREVQSTDGLNKFDPLGSASFGDWDELADTTYVPDQEMVVSSFPTFTGTEVTVEFMCRLDPLDQNEWNFVRSTSPGVVVHLLRRDGTATEPYEFCFFVVDAGGAAFSVVRGDVRIDDGRPHHVLCSYGPSGHDIFVDGIHVSAPSALGPVVPGLSVTVGPVIKWGGARYFDDPILRTPKFELGHAAIYDHELAPFTGFWAYLHAYYAFRPWDNDSTGGRIRVRMLGEMIAGWPPGVDIDDNAGERLGPSSIDGANVLEYIQRVVRTEGGGAAFWMNPAGKAVFRPRPNARPAIAETFECDLGAPFMDMQPDYTDDRVITRAEITRDNGLPQAFGIASLDGSTYSASTMHRTASAARDAAERIVVDNSEAKIQIVSLDIEARHPDITWAQVLDHDLLTVFRVVGHHPNYDLDQVVAVQSVEHAVDYKARTWKVRYQLDQAPENFWRWGISKWGDADMRWG